MTQKITFVSSLISKDMKKEEIVENIEYYISNHMHLHLYIFIEYKDIIDSIIEKNPNKIQYEIVDYGFNELKNQVDRKSSIINEIEKHPLLELPNHRNHEKDTFSYILNSHIKHELLEKAIVSNLYDSTHFAWFDFNIISLFKNRKETGEYLKWINQMKLANTYIAFPGCWSKLEKEKIDDVLNNVHWRFCGGFFIGDIHSMKQFCELYKEKMPDFLNEYKKLVWDFNFWAWLESFHEERWNPKWYRGDHNDSILYSSSDLYTRTLENIHKKTEYSYPHIQTYYPTSASYLYFQGKHLLNTRFVNYWIYPTGCYLFNNPNKLIENKNILSELNEDTLEPIYFKEIVENISLPITKNTISSGLEDIRLYELNGIVKYIATTSGYSPSGKSRMIVGTYDPEADKKKSTVRLCMEIMGMIWFNLIMFYIARNFIQIIPSPFHDIYGYDHYRLKELSDSSVLGASYVYFQTNLRSKLDDLNKRMSLVEPVETVETVETVEK